MKKWTWLMISLITAAILFGLPVYAKTTHANSYSVPSFSGIPEGEETRVFDMDTAEWDFWGDVTHVRSHMQNGYYTAYAIIDADECDGRTSFSLDLADDLSGYDTIGVGVGLSSVGMGVSMGATTKITLELSDADGNRVTSSVYLNDNQTASDVISWYTIYFDISDFPGRDDTARLRVTAEYDADHPPSVIRIANPYADSASSGFAYAERYLTDSFTADSGVVGMRSGAIRPDENERGQISLSGAFVVPEQPSAGVDAFLELTLSRVTSGGLTVRLGFADGSTAQLSRVNLTSEGGSETYTIPFRVTDEICDFQLDFDSVEYDTYFKLESVRLYYENHVQVEGNSDLGLVNSLTRSGSSVIFSGEMAREAVKQYSDAKLNFFAVPGWAYNDLTTAVSLGSMKVSTRFEFTAELSAYPALADNFMFFAALVTDYGDILPISAPVYPTAHDIPDSSVSNVGLYGAASVGVFESNVSHVIVDVALDQLLDAESGGSTNGTSLSYSIYEAVESDGDTLGNYISASTQKITVNHSLLKQLDGDINFYISAGIEVYLRITSGSEISGLTYSGEVVNNYAVSVETPEARQLYTAIIRFLCRRYSGIAGIIAGDAVNHGLYTGKAFEIGETAEYAVELAELCRITYNSASQIVPDIVVVLPFCEYMTDGNEQFLYIDPKTLTVMISEYLDELGGVPWAMMYCIDNEEDVLVPQSVKRLTDNLGLDGFAALMYCYEPVYNYTTDGDYNEYLARTFGELCEGVRARAVFLSLKNLTGRTDHNLYSYLKNAENLGGGGEGSKRSVSDYKAVSSESDEMADALRNAVGEYTLWDFSDKFYPLDWIAGGGVSSCVTVYSELFSGEEESGRYARVLRSEISSSASTDELGYYSSAKYQDQASQGSAAGIALRNFSGTIDATGADYIEFTIALNKPDGAEQGGVGTVVFVIGSDDCRAEFDAGTVEYGKIAKYVCDMSEYEHSSEIDFVGIMVYADSEVYLDLSSVKIYSDALTSAEISELFAPKPEISAPRADIVAIVFCSAIVFVLSACAAALLIRHDIEERREREERHRKREKIKTERYYR